MNREIKFRGKVLVKGISNIKRGDWIYGGITYDDNKFRIDTPYFGQILVEKETVGQYTGLHDKNGKEIYEGDIVKVDNIDLAIIYFDDDRMAWGIKPINDFYFDSPLLSENISLELRAIGNIYDNPELLGGE